MKNIYLSSVKKLLVLLMLISSLGVTAQTSVTIQPDRIGCVGDTIHIPIHVTGTNVYNMAFYITYDHVLKVKKRFEYLKSLSKNE